MKKFLSFMFITLLIITVPMQCACGKVENNAALEPINHFIGVAVVLSTGKQGASPKFKYSEGKVVADSNDVLFIYFLPKDAEDLQSSDLSANTAFEFNKVVDGSTCLNFTLEMFLETSVADFYLMAGNGEDISVKFFGMKNINSDSNPTASCTTTIDSCEIVVNLVYNLSTEGEYKK